MPDLVDKFFQEGLTEAEEQVLSENLWASEELAEKFAGIAREAYIRYGFPEPQEPGFEGPSSGPGGGIYPWMGAGLIILGLGLAYWSWNKWGWELKAFAGNGRAPVYAVPSNLVPALNRDGLKPNPRSQPGSFDASKPKIGTSNAQTEVQAIETKSKSMDQNALSPQYAMSAQRVPQESEIKRVNAPIQSASNTNGQVLPPAQARTSPQPINLDQNPQTDYSSVSAIVHLSNPTPLVVRVLDTKGLQVRPLFSGTLGPGHWVFEWDGQMANGLKAGIGFYQIEVKAGLFVERKNVEIH
jgi:hypothetical protein